MAASVLVITNMYPPHHLGGYELACADVVERWRARGHTVAVLTTDMCLPDVTEPADEDAGVASAAVWRELTFYWDDHRLTSPPPWRRLLSERANQRAITRALDRAQPDVVSVWNMGAINLGLLASVTERRVPIVLNVHDEWLIYQRRLDAWTRMWRHRPRLGRLVEWGTGVHTAAPDLSGALHCFNSSVMREHCEADPVWPFRRTEITPPGVDRHDFPLLDADVAAERARRTFDWRLLYVGRIDDRKGMATMVEALPLLPPQATITFVGRGDAEHRAALERRAVQLGLVDRVVFAALPRAELAACYSAADVLVFPSEWAEPFGLVPLEAMACGTPVVATGVGGSAEFLDDGVNCLLFAKGDPQSLAHALQRVAADPGLRTDLSTGGLATADRFTSDELASRLEHLHLAEAGLAMPQPAGREQG